MLLFYPVLLLQGYTCGLQFVSVFQPWMFNCISMSTKHCLPFTLSMCNPNYSTNNLFSISYQAFLTSSLSLIPTHVKLPKHGGGGRQAYNIWFFDYDHVGFISILFIRSKQKTSVLTKSQKLLNQTPWPRRRIK